MPQDDTPQPGPLDVVLREIATGYQVQDAQHRALDPRDFTSPLAAIAIAQPLAAARGGVVWIWTVDPARRGPLVD